VRSLGWGLGRGGPSPIKRTMLYDVATLSVRVAPRSARPGALRRGGEVLVRVASPPEGGRATEEARRLLAEALGVPRSAVALRAGARSRTKLFEIDGVEDSQLDDLVAALPEAAGD
jgi:uncharacterized protein